MDDLLAPGINENGLLIQHFAGGRWTELTVLDRDTVNNVITIMTDSFSPFALAVPERSDIALAAMGQLSLTLLAWRRRGGR